MLFVLEICPQKVFFSHRCKSFFWPSPDRNFHSVLIRILNCFSFVKCRHLSQLSLNLFGHFPWERIFLYQQYSSDPNHPCFLRAIIISKTYVCRSKFFTFSLIFNIKDPLCFRTLCNCLEIGKTTQHIYQDERHHKYFSVCQRKERRGDYQVNTVIRKIGVIIKILSNRLDI